MDRIQLASVMQFVFFVAVVGFFSYIYSPGLRNVITLYVVMAMTSGMAYLYGSVSQGWLSEWLVGLGDPDESLENLGAGVVLAAVFLAAGLAVGGRFTGTVVETPMDLTVTVLLAPIVEELFFSGFLLPVFISASESTGGFLPAGSSVAMGVFLTSVSFALYHQWAWRVAGWQPFLFYLGLRTLLCVVVLAKRSILPAMTAHMALNFAMYLASPEPEAAGLIALGVMPFLAENRLLERFDVRSDEDVASTMSITYFAWAAMAPFFLYLFVAAWLSNPGAEYVPVPQLMITVPASLIPVLVACHAALIPLTALVAWQMWRGGEWRPLLSGLTVLNVFMATVEWVFRGPYVWVVPCICLIDAITDGITYAMLAAVD